MKKLAAFLIMTLPLISPAAYVSYSLTDYNIWDWPISDGYYLLLIDNTDQAYDGDKFADDLTDGGNADIGNLDRSRIVYQGSTKQKTGGFETGETSAEKVYLAVFASDDFPHDSYYVLYAQQSLDEKTSFTDTIYQAEWVKVSNLTNSIPEPSAGLLLLTGLSVLALKRKRGACVFS